MDQFQNKIIYDSRGKKLTEIFSVSFLLNVY